MKRLCPYFVLLFCSLNSAVADEPDWDKYAEMARKATETRQDRFERRLSAIESFNEKMAEFVVKKYFTNKQDVKKKTADDLPPKPKNEAPAYGWVVKTRQVPYQVQVCVGGKCYLETRWRTESYKVWVPVGSGVIKQLNKPKPAQRRVSAPERTVSPIYFRQWSRHAGWDWPGDLRRHIQGPPHNVSRAWAMSASPQQVIGYHDGWHNQHGAR